jgi:hypothetical protein
MTIIRRAQAPRLGPLPSLGREAGARALTARVARHTRSITSNEITKPDQTAETFKPPNNPPRPRVHCPPPACGRGRGRAAVPPQRLPAQPPNPPEGDLEAPDQTAETFKALPPSRVREGPGEGGGPRATSPSTASQSTATSPSTAPNPPQRDREAPNKPPRPSKHCSPPACGRGRGRAAVPPQRLPAQPPNPPQRDLEAPDQTAETFSALLPSRVREGPGEGGGPTATSPSTASQSTPTRSRSPEQTAETFSALPPSRVREGPGAQKKPMGFFGS